MRASKCGIMTVLLGKILSHASPSSHVLPLTVQTCRTCAKLLPEEWHMMDSNWAASRAPAATHSKQLRAVLADSIARHLEHEREQPAGRCL